MWSIASSWGFYDGIEQDWKPSWIFPLSFYEVEFPFRPKRGTGCKCRAWIGVAFTWTLQSCSCYFWTYSFPCIFPATISRSRFYLCRFPGPLSFSCAGPTTSRTGDPPCCSLLHKFKTLSPSSLHQTHSVYPEFQESRCLSRQYPLTI